ncbi:DUF445 domain-containing protein [Amantichitinum ursilacus]|uniref:DUF445 domain-containing protein n=1 Tax=Amantichitinum ursilacus TaxID=857265 RepID=A0A0N0GMX8_9NEIS|nr:DUF445 domain-containing protein [Amantichitinum ursilacus]KPC52082.1 hypothetical protein WG78_13520 [Amantichitinum ursilacus]
MTAAAPLHLQAEIAKAMRLRRMRTFASALLAAVTLLYLFCLKFESSHPWLGYAAAFAEAAMIGALADWFAVTALFRYPLGIPIPHTAIIPRNKNRIADSLGVFIETHFLQPEQLLVRIDSFNPARRIAIWLARPGAKRDLTATGTYFLSYVLTTLDDPRLTAMAREMALKALGKADFSQAAASLLQVLRAQGKHQHMLDGVVRELLERLQSTTTQEYLADIIAKEFSVLRWVALDGTSGRYLARKLVAAGINELETVLVNPAHSLRLSFDEQLVELTNKLRQDPALQQKLSDWRDNLLASTELQDRMNSMWHNLLESLQADLAHPQSQIQQKMGSAIKQFGRRLHEDQAFADWLNGQIRGFAARSLARYRSEIGRFIADQLKAWDNRVLVERMELNVGVDLQYIRVNGTVVGGLVGLLIYTARHALGW